MRGACVSCGDVRRRCRLECVAPPAVDLVGEDGRPALGVDPNECASSCDASAGDCAEDPGAVTCFACVEACAVPYGEALRECLRGVPLSPAASRTFDAGGDACANEASDAADACIDACHPADAAAYAWTPESEEGEAYAGAFDPREYRERDAPPLALSSGAPSTDGVPGRLAFFGIGFAGVVLILLGVVLQYRAPASLYYAPVPADDDDGESS